MSKILSKNKLKVILNFLRNKKEQIVVVSGSFDIMHSGHIKFLEKAREQGGVLIVLLNSDCSIKKYKGPNRPIINEKSRAMMLASMSCVDYVVIFDDINPNKMISLIKPDVYCNGSDWGKNCVERNIIESNGGKIVVIKRKKSEPTTSDIIKNILKIYSQPIIRAVFLDRDGTINDNKNGYVYKTNDFKYLPGVISGLRKLSKTDYKIIIVSNQSGIGRGYYNEDDYSKLTDWMLKDLQKKNIRIDKIYYCPHKPNSNCSCRKPKSGMFLEAVADFGISLNNSWLVGDSQCDIEAGRNANIKTIKIGKSKEINKLSPNYYSPNFKEAIDKILTNK